jgi:5-methyltetrahydrofolate--homocysteine methyltransferase
MPSGRTLSGQDRRGVLELGAPCATHGVSAQLRARRAAIAAVRRGDCRVIADAYVCAYPNAGLPNALGEYDETACETAGLVRD